MTHISEVLGWKFPTQAGITTRDGVITGFPGDIPSQANQDTWTSEYQAYKAIQDTKAEAYTRIIKLIPAWKQSNLNARMNELNKKVAIDGGTLTVEEQAEVGVMDAIWTQAKTLEQSQTLWSYLLQV